MRTKKMDTDAYYPVFIFVHLLVTAITPALAIEGTVQSSLHGSSQLAKLHRVSRQVTRGNGNGLIDEALPVWRTWLQENGYDPVTVKEFDIHIDAFRTKLINCNIVGLSTIKRTGDITVNMTEAGFSGQGEVGLEKLSAKCNTQIRWSLLKAYGILSINSADVSFEGTMVQIRPPPRLTSVRITNEGTIDVEFIGDGIVGSIFQWVVQGYFKYKIQQLLTDTDQIMAIANDALAGVDVENIIDVF